MAMLSALWSEALEGKPASSQGMPGLYVNEGDMARRLAARGLAMPRQQALRTLLSEESCLGASPIGNEGSAARPSASYSLHHLLELVGKPLVACTCAGEAPPWTPALQANLEAWAGELEGLVPSPSEPLDMGAWVLEWRSALQQHCEAEVPPELLLDVASRAVPLTMPPTKAVAQLLVGSSMANEVVGKALAAHGRRSVLQKVADLPLAGGTSGASAAELSLRVRADLVAALRAAWVASRGPARRRQREDEESNPAAPQ